MMKKKLTLTAAFANYGAKLKNPRWACSAIANDGALVISCWQHLFLHNDHKRYEDRLSRWHSNHPGKKLFAHHLKIAYDESLPVRLVIATLDDHKGWISGDASLLPKAFSIEEHLVGKVTEFDGDAFTIEFKS